MPCSTQLGILFEFYVNLKVVYELESQLWCMITCGMISWINLGGASAYFFTHNCKVESHSVLWRPLYYTAITYIIQGMWKNMDLCIFLIAK